MYVAQDDGTCIMTYDFWVAGSQTGAMQLIWRLPWPFGGKSMLQPSKLSNGRGHPAQLRLSKVWRMRKWMWTLIRPGGLTTLCLQFHDAVQLPPFWTRVELSLAVVFSFECKGWDLMGGSIDHGCCFSKVWAMAGAALACAVRPALCDRPCRSDTKSRSSAVVSSLYGWLLARVQTGNDCFRIDSDIHVCSRCIAPAMFSQTTDKNLMRIRTGSSFGSGMNRLFCHGAVQFSFYHKLTALFSPWPWSSECSSDAGFGESYLGPCHGRNCRVLDWKSNLDGFRRGTSWNVVERINILDRTQGSTLGRCAPRAVASGSSAWWPVLYVLSVMTCYALPLLVDGAGFQLAFGKFTQLYM